MKCAVIGTGYVADMYAATLGSHPEIEIAGVYDRDPAARSRFATRYGFDVYETLDQCLGDDRVELVLNLTNPRSHFEITRASLEAGRHVYSEKPLGMTLDEASELVSLARERGRMLGAAPCSALSEAAQAIHQAIQENLIGRVRLVYANFEDGLIAPKLQPWTWKNIAGVPWPAKDEFEVGCTYEHAGYLLTWLALFFGPVRTISSFSSCLVPDKGIEVEFMAPDFTVACLTYDHGITARVTCGLVAPRDKSLMIVGDEGIIFMENVRSDVGPVYVQKIPAVGRFASFEQRLNRLKLWLEKKCPVIFWSGRDWKFRRRLPIAKSRPGSLVGRGKPVDFLRGPAEMVRAAMFGDDRFLTAELALHVTEIVQKIQYPPSGPVNLLTDLTCAERLAPVGSCHATDHSVSSR